jgi:hypothetical protein
MARRWSTLGALLALAALPALGSSISYSTLPAVLPPNLPSEGYEANGLAQFGGLIELTGNAAANIISATLLMSNGAYESNFPTVGTSQGYTVPLTLNVYAVGPGDTVGSLLATETVDALIPWRPQPTSACGDDYMGSDGLCHGGSLSAVTFDLTLSQAPAQLIYGLSFDTQHYGAAPTGTAGPYDSLNFALSESHPSVGSNPLPGTVYLSTGAGSGVGAFSQDTGWAPYSGAIEFDDPAASPEPAPFVFVGIGLGLIGMAWLTLWGRFGRSENRPNQQDSASLKQSP